MTTTQINFFVTGGTLQHNAPCYVMRRADDDLYQGLKQGSFCYVLTSRQMGKSSLMIHTATRLREEGVTVITLDLTRLGQNVTAEQWYLGLHNLAGEQLNLEDELEDYWFEHQQIGPLHRWMEALADIVLPKRPGRIVVMVDEIDVVRSLPFSTDEFFAGIREFYNRRTQDPDMQRLSFALFGVATPSDLIRDTRLTPFNIGRRIELTDFTEQEAVSFEQGLKRDQALSHQLMHRIWHWTGGHPYLTQRLCQAIAETATVKDAAGVDRQCETLFFTSRTREQDDNLLFVRERILRSEVDLAGLLELYRQVHRGKRVKDDETNPLIDVLRLSGIAKIRNGSLDLRNRIYRHVFDLAWVKANMPDAELRRQREAFRRGVMRAGVIAVVILAAMSTLTAFAFVQKNRADQALSKLTKQSKELDQKNTELQAALEEARSSTRKAEVKTAETQEQRKIAESQKREAEKQRQQATRQKQTAEEQRAIAESRKTEAEQQQQEARLQLLKLYEEQGRLQWLNGKTENALAYLNPAYSGGNDTPAVRFLIRQGLNQLEKTPPVRFEGHRDFVQSAAFSHDGTQIVTAGADETAKIWEVGTGKELRTLNGHQSVVNTAQFSLDGKKIVTASFDGTAKIWDAGSGRELVTLTGHHGNVTSAAFSPDGQRVVTSGLDRTAKVWEAGTGNLLLTIEGHQGSLNSAEFSREGKRILTSSSDRTAKIWDVSTGKLVVSFEGHKNSVNAAVFSPEGKLVVTGSSDNTCRIWEADSGKVVGELTGHRSQINSVRFSPEGNFLVTASVDKTARVWDAGSGKLLTTLEDNSPVSCAAFSPDGKRVVTSNQDRQAVMYAVETETRNPTEITQIIGERVAVRLVGERLAPNPQALAPTETDPGRKGKAIAPELVWGMPALPGPTNLKTFEFETVTLDEKGVVKERHKGQARYYSEELSPGVTLDMVTLPGGKFVQGSPPEEKGRGDEETQHEVMLSPFYLSKYEVTQKQWEAVMGYNPSNFKGDDLPVDQVSWNEAVEFCARLSQKTGHIYRLPTESEWEYAARAGTTTPFAYGETITPEQVNDLGQFPYGLAPAGESRYKTTRVGFFTPNAWGLFDMHGNVWEWCQDWYDDKYYMSSPSTDPRGPSSGLHRVFRGGSWGSSPGSCRSAYRNGHAPSDNIKLGFRPLRSAK